MKRAPETHKVKYFINNVVLELKNQAALFTAAQFQPLDEESPCWRVSTLELGVFMHQVSSGIF